MLAAVLNGKRRGTGFAGKQLTLGGADGAEDVLTATFFERLGYLPEPVLRTFFDVLLNLEDPIGSIEEIAFWPSFYLMGQIVEPDVVIYGTGRTLLVEAKRYDDVPQQSAGQLAREISAATYGNGIKRPIMLTVGGLQDYSAASVGKLGEQIDVLIDGVSAEYELACCSWHQIYQALEAAISVADIESHPGLQRLLDDIAATYEWHGLRTQPRRWLSQLAPVDIKSATYPISNSFLGTMSSAPRSQRLGSLIADLSPVGITSYIFPLKKWVNYL